MMGDECHTAYAQLRLKRKSSREVLRGLDSSNTLMEPLHRADFRGPQSHLYLGLSCVDFGLRAGAFLRLGAEHIIGSPGCGLCM
jgi:hypothetical protein